MCGRYTLKVDKRQLVARFEVPAPNVTVEVAPHYNIAPSQLNPVVLGGEQRHIEVMQWGLIPSWSKEPKTNYSTINARAEKIESSSVYRRPLQRQRCLVPASGFYEWQPIAGKSGKGSKQPVYFRLRDGEDGDLFAFAGLYDIWHGSDGSELHTYTIITTEANDLAKPIHERMPVILRREDEARWLDPELSDAAKLLPMLQPYPADLMVAYPVSLAVNSPAFDSAELIAPIH